MGACVCVDLQLSECALTDTVRVFFCLFYTNILKSTIGSLVLHPTTFQKQLFIKLCAPSK